MVPYYYEGLEENVDFGSKNIIFQPRDHAHCNQEQILRDKSQKISGDRILLRTDKEGFLTLLPSLLIHQNLLQSEMRIQLKRVFNLPNSAVGW